jgi:hypothetical protein
MYKIVFIIGLAVLIIPFTSAQEKKPIEPPAPAKSPSQELLGAWNHVGGKLITMAEDFPEDKYGFKAQKDERTFGENLLHVALEFNTMISAIKGSPVGFTASEDTMQKMYPTKADIIKYLKQAVADGAELLAAQGDNGLTREIQYPWGNRMVHGSYGWMGTLEHSSEHYGQLVVYYRLNDLIPPASRPKKK